MTYKQLIDQARSHGITSEKKMQEAIDQLSQDLATLSSLSCDTSHEVTRILRNQHAILYDRHYSEKFANYDTNNLVWSTTTVPSGYAGDFNSLPTASASCHGPHWTRNEILQTTKDLKFHPKVNDWDKYVAFNAMYADLCAQMNEEEIIRAAYLFYFCDSDWTKSTDDCTKIWDYISSK